MVFPPKKFAYQLIGPKVARNIDSIKTGQIGKKWGFSGTHRTSYIKKNQMYNCIRAELLCTLCYEIPCMQQKAHVNLKKTTILIYTIFQNMQTFVMILFLNLRLELFCLKQVTCQEFWIHSAGILSLFVARIEYIEVVRAKFPARSSSDVAALCSNSSSYHDTMGPNLF